jgi:hypothetical protein
MTRLCKPDWISTYLKYTEEQESPTAFHQWTAITILGATLGRRVWINRGYYTIYPNLFTIVVAGSAKCKKSTSTGIGVNLLKNIKKPPMIFSQKMTNEALIQALVESSDNGICEGLVYASELSVFMGSEAYKTGLIPTLTDLYDSPKNWSYRTRGRGVEEMENVTISILAGSTKEWLKASIPQESIGGGFTSRIIFVYQSMPRRANLFPVVNSESNILRDKLIEDLNYIRLICGEMKFTDDAKRVASEWYEKELYVQRDPKVEGYFARKHDTMFKVAMILSASESDSLLIEERHIKKALLVMEQNEADLANIMSSVVTEKVGDAIGKVLDMIRLEKRIYHQDLLKKCWKFTTAEVLYSYIKTLIEGGEIKEGLDVEKKKRY